jgi:hypothetical protein
MRFSAVVWMSCLFALLAVAGDAAATPTFPAVIKEVTGDPVADIFQYCVYCHNNPAGGLKTVTKPFGVYMMSRGLVDMNTDALKAALMAAQGEMHDTDHDGITDFDALKMGLDPNGLLGASDVPPAAYGCGGAHVAPRTGAPAAGPLLAVAVALVAAARRRNKKKRAGRDRRQATAT